MSAGEGFDFGPDLEADYCAGALRAARRTLEDATAACARAARRLRDAGRSEVEISERLGVQRLTVRRWLGRA